MNLFWLLLAMAFFSMFLLLVPGESRRKLFGFAVIGGFIYTSIVQYLAVDIFELWQFTPDVFVILNIPVFFVLSWTAVTWIYGYLLYTYPRQQLWIFHFFVLKALIIQLFAFLSNHITYRNWGTAETLFFAIFSHVLLLYLLKALYHVDELGAKADLVGYSLSLLKNRHDK